MRRAVAILALGVAAVASAGPVRIPMQPPLPAIAALGALDGTVAVAVSGDGSRAAAAFLDPKKNQASTVRLADATATRGEIPVKGVVRALAFDAAGAELLVVADRRSKRSMGETFLQRIDTATLESIREIVLPRDARDLALEDERTLLLASDGEIRTFVLPAFTSGPLYRLDGINRAIAAVPGTRRVVVGRDDGLWLIDLAAPQTRDGIPVREKVATAGPVADIVMSSEGRLGWARLNDGNVVRFRLDPLEMEGRDGTAAWIGWVGEPGDEPPAPPPPPPAPVVEAPEPVEPKVVEKAEVAVAPAPPAPPPPAPAPAPVVEAPEPVEPKVVEPKVEIPAPVRIESAPPIVPHDARMQGRITGAAAGAVVAVVVLGPDNILREAARATPDASGSWFVRDLAPGTYRVLLDAGGGRVLETSPPFRTVVVGPEGTIGVEVIEAVRIR